VTAVDYCQLLTLDAADFRDFVETYPELRSRLDDVARQRGAMNRRQQHAEVAPAVAGG
jgi:CRP-like cAMP-binding protein